MINAALVVVALAGPLLAGEPPKAVAAAAAAAPAAAPAVTKPEVKASTPTPTISSIYTAERLRDPFQPGGTGASAAAEKSFTIDDFNVHNLVLRGTMKDGASDYALLSDREFGVAFILRNGKLYDSKRKAVQGVTGRIHLKEKTVELTGPDGDVQVLRLGEEEEE